MLLPNEHAHSIFNGWWFLGVVVLPLIPRILTAVRAGLEWLSNHRQPITMGPTRVLGKREETHRWGGSRASYRYDYYVSLELESTGERAEYKVPGSLWNTVAEGDTGTAKVQGTKLHWLRVNNPKARFVPGVYGGAETSAEHAAAEQGVPAPSGGDAHRTHVPESTPVPVPHQSVTPAVTTYPGEPGRAPQRVVRLPR